MCFSSRAHMRKRAVGPIPLVLAGFKINAAHARALIKEAIVVDETVVVKETVTTKSKA